MNKRNNPSYTPRKSARRMNPSAEIRILTAAAFRYGILYPPETFERVFTPEDVRRYFLPGR